MPTLKERKVCSVCGKKTIVNKLVFNDNWYHLECMDMTLIGLRTATKKCPYTSLMLERFSTPFWIEIRNISSLTLETKIYKEFNLLNPYSKHEDWIIKL